MNANVGTVDRIARVALGLLLIALAATATTGAWAYIGIIPLATGVLRFCPAYRIFGFSSCAT
jgi:hypothetical protein